MIKVIIADDERLARELLRSMVGKDPGLELVAVCKDGAETRREVGRLRPDLLFLDIQMPGMSGVQLAHALHREDNSPHIIFVTAFDEYAIKAFEIEALDYLLKPVDPKRFRVAVERARQAIAQRHISSLGNEIARLAGRLESPTTNASNQFIKIRNGDRLLRVDVRNIVWVEAASQYVHIHTNDGSFTLARSLKSLHSELPSPQFVRVHRSAVINRKRLNKILKRPNGVHALVLDDGSRVTVSRSRKNLVEELLKECSG